MKSLVWLAGFVATVSVFAGSPNPTPIPTAALSAAPAKQADPVQPIFANTVFPEIRLNNGETLTGAKFLGASAAGANFLIGRSMRSISFPLLPSDLAQRTMLFAERARQAEEARVAAHRETDEQIQLAHSLAIARVQQRAAQNIQDTQMAEQAAAAAANRQDIVRAEAERSARDYFKHQWRPGNNSVYITSVQVQIEEVEPRAGWDGEWDVTGHALVKYYVSSGSSFSSVDQRFSAVWKEKGSFPRFVPTLL